MDNKKRLSKQAKTNPANEPKQIVIQKIDVRKPMRTEQDIPAWRQAVRSAEGINPRRKLLYTLYTDVDGDGHVESVVGKRKDAVVAANWQFLDKDGKPVDAVNQLIDTIGFDDMLNEIIGARFWGYSIFEPTFWKSLDGTWEMSAGLLPRYHYRVEAGIISYDAIGDEGVNIREGRYLKTVMEVGKVDDLGLYMKAAPYYVLKRGGLGDYAAFIQTFGNPIIDATWDGVDETQRQKLDEALSNIGAGGSIIRPDGTNVSIIENKTHDTGMAHSEFVKLLNTEISKALLGTTETTESSSSSGYAQSKTHGEADERKHDNDITYTRKVLNSRFVRILHAHGFDVEGGRFVVQGEDTELTLKEMFELQSKLVKEHNLPVDDDYWYETYKLPKPADYAAMKKNTEENKGQDPPEPTGTKSKKGNAKKPTAKDEEEQQEVDLAWYKKSWKRMMHFFFQAPAVTTGAAQACSHHHIKLAESDKVDNATLLKRIYDAGGATFFDAELFWLTSELLLKGFREGYVDSSNVELAIDLGFAYGTDDPATLTAFEQNLFKFSAGKTLAQVQELNQLFRQSSSFDEFLELARQKVEVFNGEWLETEYTTAVLTGEAAATYNRLKAQTDIFPYWKYTTAGDHLVRPAHQLLEGLVLPANDPRWKKLFPPNGWKCRCYIVPRMAHEVDKSLLKAMRQRADNYLNSPQGLKETATGWSVNRADSGEVFTANQQYIRKFKGKASKRLNSLGPSDFGLESSSKAKKSDAIPAQYEGDAMDFYNQLEELEGKRIVRDYNNRPLYVNQRNFDRHTRDDRKRRAHRAIWVHAMKEALEKPDEVWLNGSLLDDMLYLKYFEDMALVVRGKIGLSGLELISWFELAEKKSVIESIRRGLLIFKK